jgi:hypothetical protein
MYPLKSTSKYRQLIYQRDEGPLVDTKHVRILTIVGIHLYYYYYYYYYYFISRLLQQKQWSINPRAR